MKTHLTMATPIRQPITIKAVASDRRERPDYVQTANKRGGASRGKKKLYLLDARRAVWANWAMNGYSSFKSMRRGKVRVCVLVFLYVCVCVCVCVFVCVCVCVLHCKRKEPIPGFLRVPFDILHFDFLT